MKKQVKSVIKWIVFSLIVAGALALGICYIVIPDRTKSAIDIVIGYLNTPIGLGCGISITGGAILYLIIKYLIKFGLDNSKYSKKELTDIKGLIATYKEKLESSEEELKKQELEIKAILGDFESRVEYLKDYLVKVSKTSPNAKIKAIGEELSSTYETKKQELTEQLDKISVDYKSYVKENKSVEELYELIKDLESKVVEYGKEREKAIDYKAEEE